MACLELLAKLGKIVLYIFLCVCWHELLVKGLGRLFCVLADNLFIRREDFIANTCALIGRRLGPVASVGASPLDCAGLLRRRLTGHIATGLVGRR